MAVIDNNIMNIEELSIAELEKLVIEYPWFVYARRLMLLKVAESGKEHLEVLLKRCSAFMPGLRDLHYSVKEVEQTDEEPFTVIDFDDISSGINSASSSEPTKYIVIGGDYFTKEDFASLDGAESFSARRTFSAQDAQGVDKQEINKEQSSQLQDSFYTETLARIYAEQGYYEEAVKVYAKLILLYPEKSAYFAGLVNQIKSKNN